MIDVNNSKNVAVCFSGFGEPTVVTGPTCHLAHRASRQKLSLKSGDYLQKASLQSVNERQVQSRLLLCRKEVNQRNKE